MEQFLDESDFFGDTIGQQDALYGDFQPEVNLGQEAPNSLCCRPDPVDGFVPQTLDDGLSIDIPRPILQNVIASVNLSTTIDLRRVAISARNAEYNPTKVNAVILRLRNPKCTGLIFRSGKMMITGAKSIDGVKTGGKKIAKLCLKVGHPEVRFRGFKIENIIASAECGFPIRLEGLAHEHMAFCSYEPELFPGLVYRYSPQDEDKAVLLVFVSGKVLLTGCQTIDHVNSVFQTIYPVLAQYKK